MFSKKVENIYADLLNALSCAAEIRSFRNKVLALNDEGKKIFGTLEDPFLFFRCNANTAEIKKLDSALLQKSRFQTEIIKDEMVFQIQLKPLKHAMLITATSHPIKLTESQAIQTQLSLLQNILQYIHLPIYLIDITGEIIYVNAEFSDLLGYSYDQVLGQQITTFLNIEKASFEQHFETDLPLSTTQGVYPFSLKQVQIQTGAGILFLGTLHPIVADSSKESTAPIPFPCARILADSQSILETNAAFLQISGLKQAPKSLDEIFTKESLQNLSDILSKSDKEPHFNQPIEINTPKEDSYQVYLTWAKPDFSEVNLYFVDISARKNLENQIIQSHKMQAIGQLTGGIAHDFNNILTAIMGFTDLLLQQHPAGDDSFADLMHIKGNVQKAAGLVGQLLTFSRKTPVQEHLISVHDAFVDLTSLLQRAIAPLCHLKMEYKRHLGFIKMDINQLTQIFLNFAVNAKDAMPKGGDLTIMLSKEEIKRARPCGNDMIPAGSYVKIVITDNGTGIKPEILPHIFDPFFTTKKKTNQSGTGLGLSTVYGIIHSASGFVKVDSVLNVGTTFTVYLPRFEEQEHNPVAQPNEIQNVFLPEQKAPILLVDDEELIRVVTARAFQGKNIDVLQAPNAEEALKILKKTPNIQLLITDMAMPGMNGEQLIKETQKLYPNLPCLLMSGYSESYEKHTSSKEKPFEFIAKPFAQADLLAKTKEILEKTKKM